MQHFTLKKKDPKESTLDIIRTIAHAYNNVVKAPEGSGTVLFLN